MVFTFLNNKIKHYFLSNYADAPFVIQQKAQVLLWVQLILTPVTLVYFVYNAYRYDPKEFILIGTIDLAFIVALVSGMVLIKKNRYETAVSISVAIIAPLTVLGIYSKTTVQIETGSNSFYLFIFAGIAFAAMFARKKLLLWLTLFFLGALIIDFWAVHPLVHSNVQLNHISFFLNVLIVLLILFCLSYFNGVITDNALQRTQDALDKHIELLETLEDKVRERTKELQENIDHVKVLKGLLPICASCKKIRDDNGYWNLLEEYIHTHTDAQFSHGICPECAKKLYPELFEDDEDFNE